MKVPVALSLLLSLPGLIAQSSVGDRLFTVSPADGMLRQVDPLTGATLSATQLTTSSGSVTACNGLALDPLSGQLYALVRTTGSGRQLATVDPATGVATSLGTTSDAFASIAFRIDGTLFGVTGDGANVPETLYTIDRNTAVSTQVMALGNGTDGEAIAFDPLDLSIYHASGIMVQNATEVFERIDAFTFAITPITLAGYDYDEVLGMTHWTGGNLLAADLNDDLVLIDTLGQVTRLGSLDHDAKGLAFVPAPATSAWFRPYGLGCATATNEFPLLVGSGVPARGNSISFEVRAAPASSFGLLALGFGTAAIPFPSVACQLQINPLTSSAITFSTDATGNASLGAVIPAGVSQGDYYFQAGLLQSSSFVVTNPLQVHVR